MATKSGTVEEAAHEEFSNPRRRESSRLRWTARTVIGREGDDAEERISGSHEGRRSLFRETEVRAMGRNAGGVNGIGPRQGRTTS